MASILSLSPPSILFLSKPSFTPTKTPFFHPINKNPSRKYHLNIVQSSRFPSFLDLEPRSKPGTLHFDIPWFNPADRARFDVIVIGAGPAGLRLAEQVSKHGIKVCCLDPSPLSMWPNNYGVWVDEFESLGLEDCLDKTWPLCTIHIDEQNTNYLDHAYGRVNRKEFKLKLLSKCVANGVKFHKAKALKVEHEEFESSVSCDDGTELKASLIVDASGFASSFVEYDKPRNSGYQVAHGILAEVDSHPFDLDKMLLMDYRDSHLTNEPYLRASNSKVPSFLYVMPFDSNLVFLEETCIVGRPVPSHAEIKNRMVARLKHLGIRVRAVIEDEKCVIPMGGPLPKIPQGVMAIGGNSGIVHPTSGYTLARTMALAPVVAEMIVVCLGSPRMIRGAQLSHRVWNGLWPLGRRCERQCYDFGMEALLRFDLEETRGFLDAFFKLDPHYFQGYMASTLTLGELLGMGLSMFGKLSSRAKFGGLAKCPAPFLRLMCNLAREII
ncbi:hypothetical protein CASFOL_000693 [Castilleja foliolosa]|uniref:Lycopene beta-cyclase n=1 Tax=Castilleja foliolosa TaxID=1961234 RepID=A0ABD3EMB3_9LAMI